MNKKFFSMLLVVLTFYSLFIPSMSAAAETSLPEITRLAGTTRYDTARKITDMHVELWGQTNPNIPVLPSVVIANGQNYADALAGIPLASYLNSPILLTKGVGSLEPEILAKIEEYGTGTAFILGGPSAVSEEISDQLKDMGMTVTRLAGQSRYDTAVEIAQFNFDFLDVTRTAFLVSGENFPDALSAGTVAAITRANILFCPRNGEIKECVAELITENGINNIVIVGGPNAIDTRAEAELAALGVETKRIYGSSRYDTSLAVYKEYANIFVPSLLTFATGANFPDALAGGALSANLKAPVILVNNNNDNTAITKEITGLNVEKVIVYGGENAVSSGTIRKIFDDIPIELPSKTTATTTSASTTTAKPTTATTTTTSAGRWVSQSEMDRILANVMVHAESIGMHWDTTLNKDTAMWGTDTSVVTTAYTSAEDYENRVKGKVTYFYNKNVGYEYVNVIITEWDNGEYAMTCYFG